LLLSQVALVTARRDAYVAGFQLLNVMGAAEAEDLNLDGGPLYDPVAYHERYSDSWSDWDDGPRVRAVSTRTVDPNSTSPVTQLPGADRPEVAPPPPGDVIRPTNAVGQPAQTGVTEPQR
jgi:outer membrane protein